MSQKIIVLHFQRLRVHFSFELVTLVFIMYICDVSFCGNKIVALCLSFASASEFPMCELFPLSHSINILRLTVLISLTDTSMLDQFVIYMYVKCNAVFRPFQNGGESLTIIYSVQRAYVKSAFQGS